MKYIISLLLGLVFAFQLNALDLQKGFGDLTLGLSFDELSKRLSSNGSFDYAGQPEVSLSPNGKEKIIATYGGKFIDRAIFQFSDDTCFAITLELRQSNMDYFTLFQSFSTRYGDPKSLDPKSAQWLQGDTILQLEKPLVVKYLLKSVIDKKIKAVQVQEANEELQLNEFIDKL